MHGHLKAVIEDFGPLHGFCIRMGSYLNNNKSIEPQITKKFLNEMDLFSHKLSIEYSDVFQDLIPNTISELIDITAENDSDSVVFQINIVLELLMIGK